MGRLQTSSLAEPQMGAHCTTTAECNSDGGKVCGKQGCPLEADLQRIGGLQRRVTHSSAHITLHCKSPVLEITLREGYSVLNLLQGLASQFGISKDMAHLLKVEFNGVIIDRQLLLREAGFSDNDKFSVLGADEAKEKIAQANQIDIFDAVETGNTADVLLLITIYPEKVNMAGGYGYTPLHQAAANNQCDVARMLIAAGASVNATDRDGATPLRECQRQRFWSDEMGLLLKGAGAE